MEDNLLTKMLAHTLELYGKARADEVIYGNSFVEFGDRSLIIVNPKNVIASKTNKKIYGKSPIVAKVGGNRKS